SAWVEEALASQSPGLYYRDVELKDFPNGRKLLDGDLEQSRRYAIAAVAQADHLDRRIEEIGGGGAGPGLPGGRRREAGGALPAMLRRNLPFERADLLAIMEWGGGGGQISSFTTPIGAILRAFQRYAAGTPIDRDLRETMTSFAAKLKANPEKKLQHFGNEL